MSCRGRLRTRSWPLRRLLHARMQLLPSIVASPSGLFSYVLTSDQRLHRGIGCGGDALLLSRGATLCPARAASSRSAPPLCEESIASIVPGAREWRHYSTPSFASHFSASSADKPSEVAANTAMDLSGAAVSTASSAASSAADIAPPATRERRVRGTDHPSEASRTRQMPSAASIGKSKHKPFSEVKIKKKAPWGAQQLRDSWSEDAMSKQISENMSERIHREYRYHPDEFRRHYIRYTALLTIPCVTLGMSITYYLETGQPLWNADPQHLLNLLRVLDTSPRSKLYAYRLADTHDLPEHVLRHRSENVGRREHDERVFRLTHSAFERPSPDELRLLELEEQLKVSEMASEAAALAEASAV
ncbi:hypothetical protein JKF63_04855 [Porcisia hertigi]|uniref:Transmembrane protein n=1 Tax=Porcisia hertigi TaxID=2761500 RepID=A0A836I3M2_9TRYP|nr:hypothetical protein JKF63_04855 [Porcisia hertigi]